jgi:hypothetical protein
MADDDLSSAGKYVTIIPGIEVHRSKILIIGVSRHPCSSNFSPTLF